MTTLRKLAEKRGLRVEECSPGHFQILGGLCLVNYWPDSKRKSAHIAGATGARHHVTPQQAVEMAFEQPPAGWKQPVARIEEDDAPSKRTVKDWLRLLPQLRFIIREKR